MVAPLIYQPVRTPRHEYIDIRGLKHRLTCWGDATDDPIVLLHGLQDCGDTWQFLVDCLPGEWSLVAPDWRGFGGSEWAPDAYWFPDYLADLEALLESLVPKARARVIAHSMGANITGLYCGIRPRRLRWFVNLEGVGLRRTQPTEAPARYARWLDELKKPLHGRRYTSIQQLTDLLIARNARLRPDRAQFIARAWTRDVEPAPSVRLAFDPKHRLVNPVLYRLEEAEACWAHIEIPMLLLAGEVSGHQERLQTHFGEGRLDDLLRNARNVTLPGLGHMMHHEDPQAVAAEIVPFVQAQS